MNAALWADHLSDRTDGEGRFLNEQAAPGYRAEGETTCPYTDRRQGGRMNRAALDQIRHHWDDIVLALGRDTPARATLQQAFQVSLEAVCRPLLEPAGPISPLQAATYKACLGFCQVFAWLLLSDSQAGGQILSEWGDGQAFFDFLESGGWLLGERQVCAGSRGQIVALYETFCQGRGPAKGASAALEAVAIQAALVWATYQGMREGHSAPGGLGQRLLAGGRAPWFYAVTARPEGQPEWARRFLGQGCSSLPLETFLAHWRSLEPTRRDALAERLLAGL